MFTDIEGSTRLLDQLGVEAYRDAVAEHRRIVREACARHAGYEVDTEGDSFVYAFQSAQTEEKVLRLNVNSTDITYLDPALNFDSYRRRVEAMTCAMLLSYPNKAGPANARLHPEVATGFPQVSGNGKTFT